KVLAIELEFLFGDVSPNLHCLGNRGEPDSALVIDEQRPADEGKASRGRLVIVVQLFHEFDGLLPAIACSYKHEKGGTTAEKGVVDWCDGPGAVCVLVVVADQDPRPSGIP